MNIRQAKQQLTTLRQQQRELRKTIDKLRAWLRTKGIDPDPPRVDLTERNKAIYGRHLDGLTWDEIAKEFLLSKDRVKQLAKRVEKINERKSRQQRDDNNL